MLQAYNYLFQYGVAIAQAAYVVSIVPQLCLNYKNQSLEGLSDWYIMALFNGIVAELIYIFCLDLPEAYRYTVPVLGATIFILVFQLFYYGNGSCKHRRNKAYLYNLLILAALVPFLIAFPEQTGQAAGWTTTSIWCTYQIPQYVKNYQNQSVAGMSMLFPAICGFASSIELVSAFMLGLPIQSIIYITRGVLSALFFIFQSRLYETADTQEAVLNQVYFN